MTRAVNLILVPIDFSPGSESAAAYAFWLAGRLGARLRVLHVFGGLGHASAGVAPDVRRDLIAAEQEAREAGADLIVMGTHGRSGLRRMVLGSVAEQVVRSAHCPVLTLK